MNLFYLHKDVSTCAKYHCDKHVVKMILEYGQLLSGAHIFSESTNLCHNELVKIPMRYKNNPLILWLLKSEHNYKFLYDLFCSLLQEYTHRYKKQHKYESYVGTLLAIPNNIGNSPFTEPPILMDERFKQNSVTKSYRMYYNMDKRQFAKWTNRPVPKFFEDF